MTTLNQMIEIIKTENPTLQLGDDEQGYTQLDKSEYDAKVKEYAEARLAKEAKIAQAQALELAKEAAKAKLSALGLTTDDLKALGL